MQSKVGVSKKQKGTIIPLGFLLKYEPPTIAVLYKESNHQNKKKVYNIILQDLIYLDDEVDITEMLFQEHPNFLDPNVIEPGQVLALVQKLVEYRNIQLSDNQQSEAFIQSEDDTESHIFDDMEQIIDE